MELAVVNVAAEPRNMINPVLSPHSATFDARQIILQSSSIFGTPWGIVACSISQSNARKQNALAQTAAINRSQAVIEFNLDGTIVTANAEFPRRRWATGSTRSRASITASSSTRPRRESREYREFWARLNRRRVSGGPVQALRQGRQRDLDPGVLQPDPGCGAAGRSA